LSAAAVAGFAGWYEVVEGVGASGVVLDELVCFGGFGAAAPVAERFVFE
jgi:hypothetical protein